MQPRAIYFGLSNNVRGIFEDLLKHDQLIGFVKPGDTNSRILAAPQVHQSNIIVMADASDLPYKPFQEITQSLRANGVHVPIITFTDSVNTITKKAFLKAGGDALLPFAKAKDQNNKYRVDTGALLAHVKLFATLGFFKVLPRYFANSQLAGTGTSVAARQTPGRFGEFAIDEEGKLSFKNMPIELSPSSSKLMGIFICAAVDEPGTPLSRNTIHRALDENKTAEIVPKYVAALCRELSEICPASTTILASMGRSGWRLVDRNASPAAEVSTMSPPAQLSTKSMKDLCLLEGGGELLWGDAAKGLRRVDKQIIAALVRAEGKPISAADFSTMLYGDDLRDTFKLPRNMKALRKKLAARLAPAAAEITKDRHGYRLVVPDPQRSSLLVRQSTIARSG